MCACSFPPVPVHMQTTPLPILKLGSCACHYQADQHLSRSERIWETRGFRAPYSNLLCKSLKMSSHESNLTCARSAEPPLVADAISAANHACHVTEPSAAKSCGTNLESADGPRQTGPNEPDESRTCCGRGKCRCRGT